MRSGTLLLLSALPALTTGCLPGAYPRTADVLPPGQTGGQISATAVTVEPQRAEVAGGRQRGTLALPFGLEPAMVAGFFGMFELSGRVGLFRPCEGVGSFSVSRPGLELRCKVVDEDAGAPLSLTSTSMIAYSTLGAGPWGRFGLDMSRRFGTFVPLVDLQLSLGPERHGFAVDVTPANDADEYNEYGGGPHVYAVQREVRLSVPIGFAIQPEEEHVYVTGLRMKRATGKSFLFGIVPHVLLGTSRPSTEACVQCGGLPVTGYQASWGLTLALGYAWSGPGTKHYQTTPTLDPDPTTPPPKPALRRYPDPRVPPNANQPP